MLLLKNCFCENKYYEFEFDLCFLFQECKPEMSVHWRVGTADVSTVNKMFPVEKRARSVAESAGQKKQHGSV